MGYAGKFIERERARELRAESWTLLAIANELGVSKSSASLWCRDVAFVPRPGNRGHSSHKPHPLTVKKHAELERCRIEAASFVGAMTDRDLTMFALALYAGEGGKTEKGIVFANTDVRLIQTFVAWLRLTFAIDESRVRMRLYLHADLDLGEATSFWSQAVGVPKEQFGKPYRAVADWSRRANRHEHGCATFVYHCRSTHRRVMAMIEAVTSGYSIPG